MKRIIITIVISLIVFGSSGYWLGYGNGKNIGHNEGFVSGNTTGYEKGYSTGYDNGKEYVVTHLGQYVTVPKNVSYAEVVEFLKEDKTDEIKYSAENYDCMSYTRTLREQANSGGIKCGAVVFDLNNSKEYISHAINCFETNDQGVVYFDPQTDGQRYDIYVGGTEVDPISRTG